MTDTMPEKLDLASVQLSDEKLAQLRDLIPEAFTEGKIDFDALRRSLGDAVSTDPREERFGLRWPGKSRLQEVINQPSVGTLVPQPNESVDWDTTQNLIIEGDNLEVLKLLQKSYAGKVKMIYIDPPYNTGNDFVYPDNHIEGLQSYLEYTGQTDEKGRKLRTNTESEGRYHSNWLNMMYPRLYLARNLLGPDGVIFVSIDDHELANLRALMNEILGEDQFVVQILWKKRSTPPNDQIIGANHDYIVCYSKDSDHVALNLRKRSESQQNRYRNPDNHPKGPWAPGDLMANVKGGRYVSSLYYPIVNPNTGEEHFPSNRGNWRFSRRRMEELLANNEISFGESGTGRPKLKRFLSEVKQGITYPSIWDFVPLNTSGSTEMQALFSDPNAFESPKPSGLLAELTHLGSGDEDIILDFFAGSGSTAHAVMKQNAEDGGNRRYIMVQLPEPLEEPKTLDDGTTVSTIADICRERVRRAGKKIVADHARGAPGAGEDLVSTPETARGADTDTPSGRRADTRSAPTDSDGGLDVGFRAYRLAPSNFRPWDGRTKQMMTSARQASFMPQDRQLSIEEQLMETADHIRPDASNSALLAELLLKLGFELTTPVTKESIAGKTVYSVDDDLVMICLDRKITLDVIKGMAERMPAEIICLDAGFPDDQTKVNAGQIIASQARHEGASIAFKVV